jgi:tol-pal system protein YbgF
MIKYISLLLLTVMLAACSTNEVTIPDNKNAAERSEVISKLIQDQQQNSEQIEQLKRDVVLYRQAQMQGLSDVKLDELRQEFSRTGPSVDNARDESALIKQQALQMQKQQLNDVKTLLKSYTSDSLITAPLQFNSLSYEEQITEMDKEIAEMKEFINTLDHKTNTESPAKTPTQPVETIATNTAQPTDEKNPAAMLEYENAKVSFDSSDYDNAILMFKAFLKKYPSHELAANAQYWLGESYYSLQKYQKAIAEFENVTWKYPNSGKAPDAQFKLGLSYLKQSNKTQAKLELEKVKTNYPNYERINQVDSYLSDLK